MSAKSQHHTPKDGAWHQLPESGESPAKGLAIFERWNVRLKQFETEIRNVGSDAVRVPVQSVP